ncbi:unnamed protein product [Paramecium sonneborni]|uniref:Uncharacterized protein n=1 Tax=Paramecium sonneborni TaxID=65129 RepID=A0A8S1R5T5_9CILI|nr:unnamed protein product [Paramecium sonneborni]
MQIKDIRKALFIYIMICEIKKEYAKNLYKINDNVNNDDFDPNFHDYVSDSYYENSEDSNKIEDYENNMIIPKKQKDLQHIEIVQVKYNNPFQINDLESNSQNYSSLFDEQEEQQQTFEDEQNWRVKKTNQSQYRVFQKEYKKKTEQFD